MKPTYEELEAKVQRLEELLKVERITTVAQTIRKHGGECLALRAAGSQVFLFAEPAASYF